MPYEPTIGLEVHVQLNTSSKIFCSCSTDFGAKANTHVCPVCLGLPGSLPVLNEEAVKKTVLAGIALNCEIARHSKFDRKNYFYPDLPKAYQISQYDKPLCGRGYLEIASGEGTKKIGITRIHLEEDAGKLVHSEDPSSRISYVDYNRTGTPLMEIVSEPDIASSDEAFNYLSELKQIMQYLDVSDCNMEEGSLRCDVNISIKEEGSAQPGTKVEIKNLNSFRAVKMAIEFEINRQSKILSQGERIIQETRLWNPDSNATFSMRSKEEAHDYRYFPEPDLPPVILEEKLINTLRAQIPELPRMRKIRFTRDYSLTEKDAEVLTSVKALADYFEEVLAEGIPPKRASNWIQSELLGKIDNPQHIASFPVNAKKLALLLALLEKGTISGKIAKTVFSAMIESGRDAESIIKEQGIVQVSDAGQIEQIVDSVIAKNPGSVEDYRNGKEKALQFLVGQIMKESKGQANPQMAREILIKKLR